MHDGKSRERKIAAWKAAKEEHISLTDAFRTIRACMMKR